VFSAEEIAEFRAEAESRMGAANGSSTGNVRRKTGRTVQNETTGREAPVWTTVHSNVNVRIAGSSGGLAGAARSRARGTGGIEVEVGVREVHFAAATTDLMDGDYFESTAGENAGLVLKLIEVTWKDQATARRIPAEEVSRPSEWGP
jgi:hypothetical protein